ncbi:hypothetical protein TRP8649_04151 [Pelagimonas phthalicica]|uniref:Uncharacterized protein n=1 Tax=Pelagimonas phthalicica TaxID=1037362 RepID=A0A238JH53_9RHOB|nr:hypothetical protein [Pelagimonas phthalicica]TDS89844.1 hypothetical protein CLV87_3896 [Pelagimonas phthalicica]SMX30011.1 hypothetical protein TRP8649_04151 [Pelagimonas phthalicica]
MCDSVVAEFRGRVARFEIKALFDDGKKVLDPSEIWRIGEDPEHLVLGLTLFQDETDQAIRELRFTHVEQLNAVDLVQLHHVWLEVLDITSRGFETAKYEVRDIEDTTSFYCKSYTVTS